MKLENNYFVPIIIYRVKLKIFALDLLCILLQIKTLLKEVSGNPFRLYPLGTYSPLLTPLPRTYFAILYVKKFLKPTRGVALVIYPGVDFVKN